MVILLLIRERFVHIERPIYDEYIEKFVAGTKELKVGDPFDPDTEIGALVSEEYFEKVVSYLETAKEEGGTFLTGGKTPEGIKKVFRRANDHCRVRKRFTMCA